MKIRYLSLCLLYCTPWAQAGDLALPNQPLFVQQAVAPMVMLVMGRDHTLYYEAYNDASDLNADGRLDTEFMPRFKYFGLFDPNKCYDYDDTNKKFTPTSWATDGDLRKCTGTPAAPPKPAVPGQWSGNFLNYLTTSRIDALRKVLYGGKRSTDTASSTVLIRSYIPQDAHSWGKVWKPAYNQNRSPALTQCMSISPPSYSIADYTPKSDLNKVYHFASTSAGENDGKPLLRLVEFDPSENDTCPPNQPWQWAGKGRILADTDMDKPLSINGSTFPVANNRITDLEVKVDVCVTDLIFDPNRNNANEEGCVPYTVDGVTTYKPDGVLQEFGLRRSPAYHFGLISGSYAKNLSGGVLRKNATALNPSTNNNTNNEINSDGTINTATEGIIHNLDRLRITGFNYNWGSKNFSHRYDKSNCGINGWLSSRAITNGECRDWGNPIAEMLFESLRYFAGETTASTSYDYGNGNSKDKDLGLTRPDWADPFAEGSGHRWCTPAYNLVLSDINPSYDSDELPGTAFTAAAASSASSTGYAGTTANISSFNAASVAMEITRKEGDLAGKSFYIGQDLADPSAAITTNAPTPKRITDLAKIRGLSPQEPTKQGSFYSAAVAYFSNKFDRFPDHAKTQGIKTLAVALASPLPEMKFDTNGDGSPDISFIPFAKSVKAWRGTGGTIDPAAGKFQPTSTIVDYYVESQAADGQSGTFRVNFEDVEQGADHDKDFLVQYQYSIDEEGVLTIITTPDQTPIVGDIEIHAGYIISGTDKDGLYLDVRNNIDDNRNQPYYLDTLDSADLPYPLNYRKTDPTDPNGKGAANKVITENTSRTRTFTASNSAAARFFKSPLWYAARWGYYDVDDPTKEPAGLGSGPTVAKPAGYNLVTNAGDLKTSLEDALNNAKPGKLAANAVGFSTLQLDSASLAFNSFFETENWTGDVQAFNVDNNGNIASTPLWSGTTQLAGTTPGNRKIFTLAYTQAQAGGSWVTSKREFTEPSSLTGSATGLAENQIDALVTGVTLTDQNQKLDYVKALVNYLRGVRTYESTTVPGLTTSFRKRTGLLGTIVHSTPVYGKSSGDSKPFIMVGANDGMVHVLDASANSSDGGKELFAYVPSPVYSKLARFSESNYNHQYYVDGGINLQTVVNSNSTRQTIAIGSLGHGGQGIYALDLTNLSSGSLTASNRVLWEFTDKNDADMGYYSAMPSIVKLRIGETDRWVAIFGNGYNNKAADGQASITGNAVIYIVDLFTGELLKKLDSGSGNQASYSSNAMAQPLIVDSTGSGRADKIYAGDLYGNLWKFDISPSSIDDWKSSLLNGSTPIPLFTASSGQTITTRPAVTRSAAGGQLVMFGTGKFVEISDKQVAGATTQSIYAIRDNNTTTTITKDANLIQQTITGTTTDNGKEHRVVSNTAVDWATNHGWYLDLIQTGLTNKGERVVLNPWVYDNILYVTTLLPDADTCAYGGSSWYMQFDVRTGQLQQSQLTEPPAMGLESGSVITGKPNGEPTPNPDPGEPTPPPPAPDPLVTTSASVCKNNGRGNTVLFNYVKKSDGTITKIPTEIQCNGLVSWQELY